MKKLSIVFALISTSLWADELVLNDGSTIEWRVLEDKGDSYLVTPLRGEKKIIKKSDVKELRISKSEVNALAGATFTTEDGKFTIERATGKPINLLDQIDPKKGMVPGNNGKSTAEFKDGKNLFLNTAPDRGARFEIQAQLPPEYDLALVVDYLSGNTPMYMALSNPMAKWVVESGGEGTAILNYDKKPIGSDKGKLHGDMNRVEIIYMVRNNGFIVSLNGKEAASFNGDWKRLSGPSDWLPKKGGSLSIGLSEVRMIVHSMIIVPVVPGKK